MSALSQAVKLILGGTDNIGETVIRKKAEQMKLPRGQRLVPTNERLLPETVDAYSRTASIVPQSDIRGFQPDPAMIGSSLPSAGRMQPIIDANDEIASILADRMSSGLGTSDQYFYHTGPMYEAAQDIGKVDPTSFMRRFASYFGGTSPRTQTEPNLLNASMLQYRAAQGLPLDKPVLGLAGNDAMNDIGYPMIGGMHPGLASRLYEDPTGNFLTNPKPSSFAFNTEGNLLGVTADTHAIRGALSAFDAKYPGQIPRQWFKNDSFYNQYKSEGFSSLPLDSAIDDSLKSATKSGVGAQVEYGPMADVYIKAAEKLGLSPAEAQALGWFGQGAETGLRSESKTIVQLLNDRINITAQSLGLPQDVVAQLYFQGRIPLMGVGGASVGAGLLADPSAAQAMQQPQVDASQRGLLD